MFQGEFADNLMSLQVTCKTQDSDVPVSAMCLHLVCEEEDAHTVCYHGGFHRRALSSESYHMSCTASAKAFGVGWGVDRCLIE